MDWSSYGVRPTGDRKSRRFVVTADRGVEIDGKHYAKGEDISQRKAINLQFQRDTGWRSRSEYERESRTKRFREWSEQVADRKGRPLRDVRAPRSNFSRSWADWKHKDFSRDPAPHGDFADYLEGIDYRDDDADYPVGETPQGSE